MSNGDRKWEVVVYEAQRAHELELNRATAAFEHAVAAPLFLLNGGAAVAFLTLLGATSAADSTLTVDPGPSKWAVAMWAIGLFAATWAVGFGYYSQRHFTQSVSLRRQLMEHELSAGGDKFRNVLTPLPVPEPGTTNAALPTQNNPRPIHGKAKKLQQVWLACSALSSALFLAGVVFAAFAVLD